MPVPASRRPPPRSATRSARSVSASNSPYSDSFSFCLIAICLIATLCAAEPVKYCSAAPQASSGTTRRSAVRPLAVRTVVLAGRGHDVLPGGERRHQRRRVVGRREDVDVADGLATGAASPRRRSAG